MDFDKLTVCNNNSSQNLPHLHHSQSSFLFLCSFCSFIRSQLLSPYRDSGHDLLLGIVLDGGSKINSFLAIHQWRLVPRVDLFDLIASYSKKQTAQPALPVCLRSQPPAVQYFVPHLYIRPVRIAFSGPSC